MIQLLSDFSYQENVWANPRVGLADTSKLSYGQPRQGDFTKEGASHRLTKRLTKPYPRMWYILVMSKLVTRTSHRTLGWIWWCSRLWARSLLKRLTEHCDPNSVMKQLVTIMYHQNDTFVQWASSLVKRLTKPWVGSGGAVSYEQARY